MTDPRTYALYADEPEDVAAATAWRDNLRARGWTQDDPPVKKEVTIWTVRKPNPALPAPLGPSNTGVDVSRWNNGGMVIDFAKVKAAGHRFVFIKRSQGLDWVDPLGAGNFSAALGKMDWISNYHFFTWRDDGAAQADHFSHTCGEALGNMAELVDVELLPDENPATVDKARAEANLRALLARCEERFHRKPMLYTSRHYWMSMFDTGRVADIGRDYKFLIADWTPPLDLPPGVPHAHFWQKSSTHTIPGLTGNFDLDEYRGDQSATAPVEPDPWWVTRQPPYNLAIPNRVVQFYTVNGVALTSRNVTWTMRVVERQGEMLKVFDQVGDANDWWVKAQDVQPA